MSGEAREPGGARRLWLPKEAWDLVHEIHAENRRIGGGGTSDPGVILDALERRRDALRRLPTPKAGE